MSTRYGAFIAPAVVAVTAGVFVSTFAEDASPAVQDGPRSPVQRPAVPTDPADAVGLAVGGPAVYPIDFRAIDGLGGSTTDPLMGRAGTPFLRLTTNGYDDGAGKPRAAGLVSARAVSNSCMAQDHDAPNGIDATDYLWQWGQFVDHDIDETPVTSPGEPFDIIVPLGDLWFDPGNTGLVTIPLDRSAGVIIDGVRRQMNNITAFVDASNVYGSDQARADALRTMDGTGRLATSTGDLLPFNVGGFPNAPTGSDPSFFLAGDVRANEQIALTALHTLFVREHNHWAGVIATDEPGLTGDEVYERARAIVAAEMQAITYREFLPVLLGPNSLPSYSGPQTGVDASIANVFATAAYRVGHTMLSSQLLRLDAAGQEIGAGHIALADAFFRPDEVILHGIDPLLRGLALQRAQDVDVLVIDDVRNFLFGAPGSGGFDLASLNVQRGRDHGLAPYNQVRVDFGLPAVTTFADISPDPDVQAGLAASYATVNDIDAWAGMLAEPHVAGAMVGETIYTILVDQFRRLRDGDRFWYETYLPPDLVALVESETLAEIIRRNTGVGSELQDDVFVMPLCVGDIEGSGEVDITDLLAVLAVWGPCVGCPEDIDDDDVVGVGDLLILLAAWGMCP